jgi:hypothetical protein
VHGPAPCFVVRLLNLIDRFATCSCLSPASNKKGLKKQLQYTKKVIPRQENKHFLCQGGSFLTSEYQILFNVVGKDDLIKN